LFTRSVGQAFEEAYRIGQVGLLLLKKFNARPWLARTSNIYYDLVHGWVRPLEECRVPLLDAYNIGLQSGDTEFAVLCATENWFMRFDTTPLPELEHEIEILTERMELYGLKTLILVTTPARKLMQHLMGIYDGDKIEFSGNVMVNVDNDNGNELESTRLMFVWNYVHRAFINFLFGNYPEASKQARVGAELAVTFYGPYRGSFIALICGLAFVAHARQIKRRRICSARKYSKLLLRWATQGEPRNFIGNHYLLEAEIAALAGQKARSYNYYIVAIAACREGKFLLQTAIATERVAKSLWEWGDRERATPFFKDAVVLYKEWGASTKVLHLESEILQLGL
jgi:hypothetical protein